MISSPTVMRVLIADDDSDTREALAETLTSLGHDVVAQAASGDEAAAQARTAAPDVVLLDVHMPGGSGVDAAKAIALESPATAVVLLTGDEAFTLSERDVVDTAAVTLLPKPARRNTLDSALRLAVVRARTLTGERRDTARFRKALADRKVIERAKGVLMRRTGRSEQEAYRILQRSSQDRSMRMVDVAQEVLDNEFGPTPPPTPPTA